MGFRLQRSDMNLSDLEGSKVKVTNFDVEYLENGCRYDVGLNGGQIGNRIWAFDCDCHM